MIKTIPHTGDLLIAEPSILNDNEFSRAVILLTEHGNEGSVGFVLNRLSKYKMQDLFSDLNVDFPAFKGGPVATENLYFIHSVPELIPNSVKITNEIYWGGNFEAVKSLLKKGLLKNKDIRFFLGYSGWSKGQLFSELKEKSWIIKTNTYKNVFLTNPKTLWKEEILKLGNKYKIWANAPQNPRLN
jgi:putative transcriptional regulator